jgi:hypothetical protein
VVCLTSIRSVSVSRSLEEDARGYLRALGFRDPEGTDRLLQAMAEDMAIRQAMGRIAGDLLPRCSSLQTPMPR